MSISDNPLTRLWIKALIFLAYLHWTVAHPYYTKTVLKFGQDNLSFILLEPDMSPASEALSVCAWVKRDSNHLSNYQYWLSYVDTHDKNELVISDTGRVFLFKGFGSRTETDLDVGEWHHMCLTWLYQSRTKTVYYDGKEIGTQRTPPGRKFRSTGTLMLGQLHKKYGGGGIKDYHFFGGELLDFNIFSTQLTSEQITEMFAEGRCSNYTHSFGTDRYVPWEDIIKLDRNGTVTENHLVCEHDEPHPTEAAVTQEPTEESDSQYTDLLEEIELIVHTTDPPATEMVATTTQNSQLAEVFKLIERQENLVVAQPEDKWEFLYDQYFYGQEITESFLSGMIRRLDFIVEYFGRTIEETLINDDFIDCMGERLDLLIEFFGHTMDNTLIGHLEKYHATGSSGCSGFLWSQLAGFDF